MYNLLSITTLGESIVNKLSELGIWYLVLVNVFGILAIVFKVFESQLKKRSLIVLFAIASTFSWIIYYLLNGNIATALIVFVSIMKYFVFMQREKYEWANSPIWLILFIAIQVILLIFSVGEDWTTLFSAGAGVLNTFAYYVLDVKKYKYILLASQICWVFNGVFNGYVVAYVADIIICIAIIVGILRYTIEEKKEKNIDVQ